MDQALLNKSRNDKFIFLFGLPAIFKQIYDPVLKSDLNDNKIEFAVYAASIPPINVPSVTIGYGAQTYKTSSFARPDYIPLELKFFLDNGYHNYYILWKWLDLFNDSKSGTSEVLTSTGEIPRSENELQNPFTDYTTDIKIHTLDEYNNKLMSFTFKDAFITGLGNISYSHREGMEITCSATFAYNQFYANLESNVNGCLSPDCDQNGLIVSQTEPLDD